MANAKDVNWLGDLTKDEVRLVLEKTRCAVLLPVGSVEPHGPHLPLGTDLKISERVCELAAAALVDHRVLAVIAPSVPYGVTNFARGFKGGVSVGKREIEGFLEGIVGSLLDDGWSHVSVVNNHLEPAHVEAINRAIEDFPPGCTSAPSPLNPRWGATLSDEFKSGACHAGQYETSLMLAAGAAVRDSYKELPSLDISLSDGIKKGQSGFLEMGMDEAYTGSPKDATEEEGRDLFKLLTQMVVTEIVEAMG